MQYKRDNLLKDLRENVIEVFFTKVNGEERAMICTLKPEMLPPSYLEEKEQEKKFHKENNNVIAAWDIQNRGWRSFRIDSVSYVQVKNYG
jgi:hypothetical protein